MSIINNISKLFASFKANKKPVKLNQLKDPTSPMVNAYGSFDEKKIEYLSSIRGYAFSCISAIADNLAFIELRAMKMNSKGEVEEVDKSDIVDRLFKVNDYTTKFDHFWLTAAYLESVGEAPWFLDKSAKGEIIGIYILDPSKITPVPSKEENELISHYNYDIGQGKKIEIPAHQIVFLKQTDPANPFRGLGTMKAASRQIDIENKSEQWNWQFFKNNATPSVKLTVQSKSLTKEQRERLKSSIKEQYQGVEKSQQVWVLFDGMDAEPFGPTAKDMDFNAQQKFTFDKIRSIFRVPLAILGQTEGVNFASARVAQEVFIKNTIVPKMERIVQQLNEFLVPQFDTTGEVFLDYKNPLEIDRELQLKIYDNAIKNGWMTINEVREKEGLPSIGPAGDQVYIPLNIQPIGSVTQKAIKEISYDRLMEVKARKNKQKIDKEMIVDELSKQIKTMMINGKKSTKEVKKELTQDQKEAFWRIKASVFDKYLDKYKEKMSGIFTRQEKEVLRSLGGKDIKVSINKLLLNKKKEEKVALDVFVPIASLLMADSAEETFAFLGVDMALDIESAEIQRFLKSRTSKFALAATDTTNNLIKRSIGEAIELGESIPQMSKRISGIFSSARDFRSDRIARTEVTRFNVDATERAFIESGVVEGKEWMINPDACPICQPFSGKTVGLGESFAKLGDEITTSDGGTFSVDYESIEHPPMHPNCRCDLVPVFKSGKSLSSQNKDIIKLKKSIRDEMVENNNDIKADVKEKIDKVEDETVDKVVKKIDDALDE